MIALAQGLGSGICPCLGLGQQVKPLRQTDIPPGLYPTHSSRVALLLQTPNTPAQFYLAMLVHTVPSSKMSIWLNPTFTFRL